MKNAAEHFNQIMGKCTKLYYGDLSVAIIDQIKLEMKY